MIIENLRTLDAARAMSDGDAVTLGTLMNSSHDSLRDDYEVSGPALDQIVEIARNSPGCFGARMTGGGIAGCAVALVRAEQAIEFRIRVEERYRNETRLDADIWLCEPATGGSVMSNSG